MADYLRFPHVSGDQLVFTADDDVWLARIPAESTIGAPDQAPMVAAAQLFAHRLTADQVPVSRPRLSPDGEWVAWVSRRAGEPEVFAMALADGVPRQLTHFGSASTAAQGFDLAGRLIVTSAGSQPFRSRTWAYLLDLSGPDPVPQRLPFGPVNSLAYAPNGAVVVGTGYSRDPAHWKRYRGGTAGRLWLAPEQSAEFTEILADLVGPKTAPVWIGDRLAFLADFQGHGNVYSVDATATDLRRHTDHAEFYARQLSGDGQRLVYAHAGQLWLLEDLEPDSVPRRLQIELPGGRSGRGPVELNPAEHIGEFSVDATGRASAIEVRGNVYWLTHRDGPAQITAPEAGARHRLPVVLGDGLAYITDADGADAIELATTELAWTGTNAIEVADSTGQARRICSGELGRVLELAASPDASRLAVATHDGRVLLIATEDGTITELSANPAGDSSGLAFSPDSNWLAYSAAEPSRLRSIKLVNLSSINNGSINNGSINNGSVSSTVTDVTRERFGDSEPVFSLDGKYLVFLSARTFDPVYDAHVFDLSFPLATRPYLVTLAAATPSPFNPELAGRAREDVEPDEASSGRHTPAGVAVGVDTGAIADRIVAFPVPAGRLSQLAAVKGGVVWAESPIAGQLGESREPEHDIRPSLNRWDFGKRTSEQLLEHLDDFAVSGDGSTLLVRDHDALRALPAEHRAAEDGHESIEVDLARLRLRIDPPIEWAQMLRETARLMRDHFWTEDMSGLDWDAAVARWLPVLDTISTRDDLSDVLWELNGETGSSHAYEIAPAVPVDSWRKPAFLGADLTRDETGSWIVQRVIPGDNSAREARSPLTAPGVGVLAGQAILAVNGVPVPARGPAELLRGTAGKPVQLLIGTGPERRSVVVIPLASDTALRYLDWVSSRRAAVHAATAGRVGYVHVPDMMSAGWAAFHRDLRVEISRDALIVDTRDNNGGHTSQLVIEKLARRVIGWDTVRHMSPATYPEDAPRGPLLCLANEWSGSDGDIVNAAFQALGLGPVLGTRTWGGVIGIDGRYSLVDGTGVTQPRYSFWFDKFGWDVENHGVDPDQVVEFPPHAWGAGADPQLDAAIEGLLAELGSRPAPRLPDLATRRSLRAPELPPR